MISGVCLTVMMAEVVVCADSLKAVESFAAMFSEGKVSGRLESIYSLHDEEHGHSPYSTAAGGQLKYESAVLKGFSAGAEFTTSYDLNGLSGDGPRHNSFISSTDGRYTQLSQSYLDFRYDTLHLRVGRQLIDTPLADSDDYRIIDNTFEAALVEYEIFGVTLLAGYLDRWQGTDAGLNPQTPWQDTGKEGTYMASVAYETETFGMFVWYYDISEAQIDNTATGNVANTSYYAESAVSLPLGEVVVLDIGLQYLQQEESAMSGIESTICGALAEMEVMEGLSLMAAYNHASRHTGKQSFSGFGGGALYTSMDNMILDNITLDRKADAMLGGVTYSFGDVALFYAYADFAGGADSLGQKEHVVEQDLFIDYAPSENLIVSAIVVISDDKEETGSPAYYDDGDFVNYRLAVAYAF